MAKFCKHCGSKLDESTGLCPVCDAKKNKKRRKPHKFLRVLLCILGIVFGIGIIIAGILIFLKYEDNIDISQIWGDRSVNQNYNDNQTDFSLYVPDDDALVMDKDTGKVYVNNIIIVFFEKDTTQEDIAHVVQSLDGEVVGSIPGIDQYQIRTAAHTLDELESICQELKKETCVFDAIYDQAFEMDGDVLPDDPWSTWLWNKEEWNVNNPDGKNWWAEAIGAPEAWELTQNLDTIKVGIVDNGFDNGHQDLKKKLKYVSPINNKADHGTHVAGIIGAKDNNKKGITGIVWNSELYTYDWQLSGTQEVVTKLFDMPWSTFNQILSGMTVLVEKGAKVINFSVGQTASMNGTSRSKDEIDVNGQYSSLYMNALLSRGYDFLVVQSSGNGNENEISVDAVYNGLFASINSENCTVSKDVRYEDIINRVVIVGAAQNDGNNRYSQTYWSNAGERVDICAPGDNIYSTIPGGWFGTYGYMSGTSMAAPMVTGVASLVWECNSKLSGAEVKDIVCDEKNTKYTVADNTSAQHPLNNTYRLVNAELAVKAALNYKKEETKSTTEIDLSDVPSGAVEFNGHYYYLYDGGIASTYDEALQFCKSKNGYLATLTSKEENEFVYSYMRGRNCSSAYFGLSDTGNEGIWEWCTGEEVSYLNWHSGEPNGENSNEDYGHFYYKYTDGTWNDGNFGKRTVNDGTAFICEWGTYTTKQKEEATTKKTVSGDRNIVLTLDVSGSMSGYPIGETKKASSSFVNTVLEKDASIGIVTYEDEAECKSDFSVSKSALQNIISQINGGGGTNIEDGLRKAQNMLREKDAKKKIIVLMSDGEPNEGKEGEELIAYANEIKQEGTLIYTLGFFESLGEKSSAQRLMEKIASDGCHYEVASADDLVFFFEDMADQINGQKYIYVRIACPVDVSVTYNGQTLSSAESNPNFRTDFGTLTFEENEESISENQDDRIKVLRLKEGADYDLAIEGNGRGIMNYTIGFMDEEGDYTDLRKFENIKITKKTKIDTVAAVSPESILNIDENGDGTYDLRLRAEENGYGEEIKIPEWILYAIIGAGILVTIDIIILVVLRKMKKKGGK